MRYLSRKVALMLGLQLLMISCGRKTEEMPATKIKVGEGVADFSLPDVQEKMRSLHEFKGKTAIAIVFIGVHCPYTKAFTQVMARLAREYAQRDVVFVGIDANKNDSVPEVSEYARSLGTSFVVLKDKGNVIADRLGAQVTPEIFLLDRSWTLCYHGAIGNSHKPTTKPQQASDSEFRPALEAVIDRKPVAIAQTKAFG